jgi:hypothetical protein
MPERPPVGTKGIGGSASWERPLLLIAAAIFTLLVWGFAVYGFYAAMGGR